MSRLRKGLVDTDKNPRFYIPPVARHIARTQGRLAPGKLFEQHNKLKRSMGIIDKEYPEEKDKKKQKSGKEEDDEKYKNALIVKPQPKLPEDEVPEQPGGEYVGQHPFRMLISGDSGSGKSTVLIHMVNNFYADYFDQIWVFAKTIKQDPIWRNARIDKDKLFEEFDGPKIEEIRAKQKEYIEKNGIATADKVLILVDDQADNKSVMHHPVITAVAFHGRKDGISLIVLSQKYNKADLSYRVNLSIVICFPSGNDKELKALEEEQRSPLFPPGVQGTKLFRQVYRFCMFEKDDIDDYPFMVVNHQDRDKSKIYRKRLGGVIKLKIGELDNDSNTKDVEKQLNEMLSTDDDVTSKTAVSGSTSGKPQNVGAPKN